MTGDVITCTIDCDDGIVTFYRNGVSLGTAYDSVCIGPNMAYFPALSLSRGETVRLNFGSTPFMYPLVHQPLTDPPSFSLSLFLYLSHSLSLPFSLPLFMPTSLPFSLPLSLRLSLLLFLTLSLSLSPYLSFSLPLSRLRSATFTHTSDLLQGDLFPE